MGISATILFKKGHSVEINQLLLHFNQISDSEGWFHNHDLKKYDDMQKLKYSEFCLSDIPLRDCYERQICFGIADEPYPFKLVYFEWDSPNNEYFKTVVSSDFDGNEDLLFQVLLAVLIEYPDAKVWIEENWFYTLDDLKRINDSYHSRWCYMDPQIFREENSFG
jgi:hypothetical protein